MGTKRRAAAPVAPVAPAAVRTREPAPWSLAGRHVAITGAGSGIGRAIALRLARHGAVLSLFGRRPAPLAETAREAQRLGAEQVGAHRLDVRQRAACERSFAAAAAARGPLFALVANAGIGGPNAPGPGDRFDELVATNLTGVYNCSRAAERRLAPGPGARHVLLMSSILGRIGVPGYTGYCAAKTGVIGLARALALELAPANVQVNALCPGWVETDMAHAGLDGMAKALGVDRAAARKIAMSSVPLGRMSAPEDVAGLVAWLLSPDARGVTGQALDMNNGAFML